MKDSQIAKISLGIFLAIVMILAIQSSSKSGGFLSAMYGGYYYSQYNNMGMYGGNSWDNGFSGGAYNNGNTQGGVYLPGGGVITYGMD